MSKPINFKLFRSTQYYFPTEIESRIPPIKQIKPEPPQLKLGGANRPPAQPLQHPPHMTVHYTSVGDTFKTLNLRQLKLPWSTLHCGSGTRSSQGVTMGTLCQEMELL